MTVPRAMTLRNVTRKPYTLVSKPYNMAPILDRKLVSNLSLGNGGVLVDYSSVSSGAIYFNANLTSLSGTGTVNFTFSSSVSGEYVSGGFFSAGDFWRQYQRVRQRVLYRQAFYL